METRKNKSDLEEFFESGEVLCGVYPYEDPSAKSVVVTDRQVKKMWRTPREVMEAYLAAHGGTWENSKCGTRKSEEPHCTKDGRVYFQIRAAGGNAFIECSLYDYAKSKWKHKGSQIHLTNGEVFPSRLSVSSVEERYQEALSVSHQLSKQAKGQYMPAPSLGRGVEISFHGSGYGNSTGSSRAGKEGSCEEGLGGIDIGAEDLKDAIHVSGVSSPEALEKERMKCIAEMAMRFQNLLEDMNPLLDLY